jgi:probable F420-dependent oxidoreductase
VPIPGGPASVPLPREYTRTLDPFVCLAAAAAVTERIRLGTGVCLVVQRDPIQTAKAVASLDVISGGRALFGVGAGWNLEEMRDHGTDPATRFGLLRERVEAMRELWTAEEASYAGRHVRFERAWQWPKPVQRPHPPVLVGGNGPRVLDRVLAFGDGWMPNPSPDDDTVIARADELRRRAGELGRQATLTISSAPADPRRLTRYAEAGFERAIFFLPQGGWEPIERRLRQVRAALDAAGTG